MRTQTVCIILFYSNFIFTSTLWASLGWECVTDSRTPSKLPLQSGCVGFGVIQAKLNSIQTKSNVIGLHPLSQSMAWEDEASLKKEEDSSCESYLGVYPKWTSTNTTPSVSKVFRSGDASIDLDDSGVSFQLCHSMTCPWPDPLQFLKVPQDQRNLRAKAVACTGFRITPLGHGGISSTK